MILGAIVTLLSLGNVIYQVWMIERNKAEILSLYALLQMKEIGKVFTACSTFMDIFNKGSLTAASE